MSLLSYSSPWKSDDSEESAPSRKRIPSIGKDAGTRKTVKARPEQEKNREEHVHKIIDRITSFSNDERLGDFNPMPYPPLALNQDSIIPAEDPIEIEGNPLVPPITVSEPVRKTVPYYRPAETNNYTNYKHAYGREGLTPYYAKSNVTGSGDKLMDRIQYMTQMLESLQMEKTNHVTEEFVLYTLLGVFMIYIVDGFSRGGKYIR
jgi:hypothetical protein